VPEDAVIDSGDRRLVILDRGEGRFEPRAVEVGRRGAGYAEIRSGIAEGDVVVTSANFLIDAESNLKAALRSLNSAGAAQ
jgi:Cu(I)/Ag(I) efflux system membrane fusion protein